MSIPSSDSHPDFDLLPDDESDYADIDPETEELTAYLDGELNPEEALRVEQRLSADPQYLLRLQSMQRAWDALDAIPIPNQDETFVRTTMELVVADLQKSQKADSHRRRRWEQLMMIAGLPLLLGTLAFLLAGWLQTNSHRVLQNNFQLLRNLDKYRELKYDIDFLVELDRKEVFPDSNSFSIEEMRNLSTVIASDSSDGDTSSSPKTKLKDELAELSKTEIQVLRSNFELFEKLPTGDRKQIETFHRTLAEHKDSERLRSVMQAYCHWLKNLNMTETARLLDLSTEQRMNEVVRIKSGQEKAALGKFGATRLPMDRDVEHLSRWFDLTIRSNQLKVRQHFPQTVADYIREYQPDRTIPLETLNEFSRRQPIRKLIAILLRVDRSFVKNLIAQNIDLLRVGLSYEAQTILAEQNPDSQKELVLNWIEAATEAKSTIPEDKLQAFYLTLPPEQRDKLDQLSLGEWLSELTRLYWERNRGFFIRMDELESLFDTPFEIVN